MHYAIPIVAGIGNALMAEPLVRQLRMSAPEKALRVSVVAMSSAMGEVFRRIRGVNVVVSGKGAWRMFAALRGIAPIDVLLVPFPSNRWQYNVLAWRSGARRVIMHSYPVGNRAWLSSRVGERIEAIRGLHDVNQNLRLLEPLEIKPRFDDAPRFVLEKDDHRAAEDLLREVGIDRKPFVAVHAGSARTILAAAKRWPTEKYAELLAALRAHASFSAALLEGPDERGVANEIVEQFRRRTYDATPDAVHVIPLRGNLGTAAAMLSRAKLYVGTDSGLAHLAVAVGTRAITLFAPADPDRVAPFGNRDLVIQPNKPCSPCFLYPWESTKPKMRCRPPFCVAEISVEMVMAKVRTLLPSPSTLGEG
jgi:ADP-heptose:LPS heptosyltransferase